MHLVLGGQEKDGRKAVGKMVVVRTAAVGVGATLGQVKNSVAFVLPYGRRCHAHTVFKVSSWFTGGGIMYSMHLASAFPEVMVCLSACAVPSCHHRTPCKLRIVAIGDSIQLAACSTAHVCQQ